MHLTCSCVLVDPENRVNFNSNIEYSLNAVYLVQYCVFLVLKYFINLNSSADTRYVLKHKHIMFIK